MRAPTNCVVAPLSQALTASCRESAYCAGETRRQAAGGDVHVSAVIGDLVDELRPTMSPMAVDSETPSYDMFDSRVFYQEPVPDLREFSFLVGDSPDRLSQAVAKAVGIAAGHPNQVFRERYSFDPTKCPLSVGAASSKCALAGAGIQAVAVPGCAAVRHVDIARLLLGDGTQAARAHLRQSRPPER